MLFICHCPVSHTAPASVTVYELNEVRASHGADGGAEVPSVAGPRPCRSAAGPGLQHRPCVLVSSDGKPLRAPRCVLLSPPGRCKQVDTGTSHLLMPPFHFLNRL